MRGYVSWYLRVILWVFVIGVHDERWSMRGRCQLRRGVRGEGRGRGDIKGLGVGGWHLVVGVHDVGVDVFAGALGESLAPALHK